MRVEEIAIARGGTALRVRFAGGAERLVRRVDLVSVLGQPNPARSRFGGARVIEGGDAVEVDLRPSGIVERIAARLLGERSEAVEIIVTTRGLVMTLDGDGLGLVDRGAVAMGGGRVLWVGPAADLDGSGLDLSRALRIDAEDRLVTPGLIDCHAHPVFAGDRAQEFAARAAGQSYLDIARAGGGIAATVKATRAASFDDLVALACARLARSLAAGTTTMEAKSGYDLTVDGELRLLEAALATDSLSPVDLCPTLLGAHVVPPERAGDRAGYLADVAGPMIARAAKGNLAAAVDVYCDEGAFTLAEARQVLQAARTAGLLVRAHAGQFADLGAAELVAELGGVSADHLERVSPAGMRLMATHAVVAVMLPGACVQLRLAPPPVGELRAAGVAMAIGSDLNPGSSNCESLPVQMWLATTHYGMTVDEAWLGVTRHAARVLGRTDLGLLAPGAAADVVVWDAGVPADVPYRYGGGASLVRQVIKAGRLVG
jgi:imidazolonepropionase